jgi:hypothetical protein
MFTVLAATLSPWYWEAFRSKAVNPEVVDWFIASWMRAILSASTHDDDS